MKKTNILENKTFHLAVIVFFGLIVFSKSISYDFVWDDEPLYLNKGNYPENSRFENLDKFWTPGAMPMYAPVTFTAWAVISSLSSNSFDNDFGLQPTLFHLSNIIFHILNSILVYLILFSLFKFSFPSFAAALIFLLHPIQVESAVWISELRGVLAGFFGFLGIYLYLIQKHENNKKMLQVCLTTAFLFALSFLSKPSGIVFPALILIIDYFFLKSDKKQRILNTGLFIGLSISMLILSISAESAAEHIVQADFLTKILLPFDSFTFYLTKVLVPINLTAVYGRTTDYLLSGNQLYLYSGISILLFVVVIILRKKLSNYFSGLLIIVIALLPTSGITAFYYQTFSNVADRYFYLAMFGVCLIFGLLFTQMNKKNQYIVSIFITLPLIIITTGQISSWSNNFNHWDNVIKTSSIEIPQAYMGRGEENLKLGEYQKAIDDFSKAINLNPEEGLYFYNRANAYLDINQLELAISDYTNSIDKNPYYLNAYINRGIAYSEKDEPINALYDFKKAYSLEPKQTDICNYIGVSFAQMGKFDSAYVYFKKALSINPSDLQAIENLKRLEDELKLGK